MAYVYRHIRLDKNEPFYIGVGEDNAKNKGKYVRAYEKYKRSKHWKDIFNKTKIEVEILMDELSYENAFEKEREFIKLYGRIRLKTGTLCNQTDGGPGMLNAVLSKKTIQKSANAKKIPIIQKDLEGNVIKIWDCVKDAQKAMGIHKSIHSIRDCLFGEKYQSCGFRWEYLDEKRRVLFVEKPPKERKKIVQMNLSGEVVKIWDCVSRVNKFNFSHSVVIKCCKRRGIDNVGYGYKWEYFEDKKQYIFSENLDWERKIN